MIHCGKIPIYCAKSPIQCKITCCGQNCTLNVWLHHENHTLSCTFFVNYTTFVKYMDHFHVQSRKFYTWQKKLHRLWCLWQIWGPTHPVTCESLVSQEFSRIILKFHFSISRHFHFTFHSPSRFQGLFILEISESISDFTLFLEKKRVKNFIFFDNA